MTEPNAPETTAPAVTPHLLAELGVPEQLQGIIVDAHASFVKALAHRTANGDRIAAALERYATAAERLANAAEKRTK